MYLSPRKLARLCLTFKTNYVIHLVKRDVIEWVFVDDRLEVENFAILFSHAVAVKPAQS